MKSIQEILERAWRAREFQRAFAESEAVRVFHGPGEGVGDLKCLAIDRFGAHFWVTEWEGRENFNFSQSLKEGVIAFLKNWGGTSAVYLSRPKKGVPSLPQILFGSPPQEKYPVQEGSSRFLIKLIDARHPGLFLDHQPLRAWLEKNSRGLRVLNTFAYTGSLSVAAARGGARSVTTLDLSGTAIDWARGNMALNGFSENSYDFWVGDVFEVLPRLKREKKEFDCLILDPPSFSHGKKGNFSTSKDLEKLHSLALDVLSPSGFLVTTINSANVSWKKFEDNVFSAARKKKVVFSIIRTIDLPETFPTLLGQAQDRYLKGWILRRAGDPPVAGH